MSKSIPILPIGPVNTKTGKNPMLGDILQVWNNSAFMVVKEMFGNTLRAVAGSGSVQGLATQFPQGHSFSFCHDQTRKSIGRDPLLVMSHHALTAEGLEQARQMYGITSVQMSTLK